MSQLKFDLTVLEKLFPFCFVVDQNGNFVVLGPSIKKLLINGKDNQSFDEVFDLVRPTGFNFEKLAQTQGGEMIAIKIRESQAELMGQIMDVSNFNHKLFVMNLVVQDADELTNLNLDFNDFAIQDPIFDYLMLLQTQRRAIRHADELNKKLSEAHKIAVHASETKSRFLANMSHELRTPMNGILGMASILQETTLSDEQKDYVQTLVTSGEAMLTLVNDILDLSKIEAGFVNLEIASVDIHNLIYEAIDSIRPIAQRKNLSLNIELDQNAPKTIHTDRSRLRQVIMNLLGNAIKFTEKGNVTIKLSTTNDSNLLIAVKDSGIGMNEETMAQLFSPFVQGDSSMTKKFEGTGLGLSICKRLIEALGGKIEARSTVGVGSEFIVLIKNTH